MFGFFLHGQTGSNESRLRAFAGRRICRIATVLGEEEARRAIEQAEEEYGKSMDPRGWDVYKNGTPFGMQGAADVRNRTLAALCLATSECW